MQFSTLGSTSHALLYGLLLLAVPPLAEADELFGVEAGNLVTIDTATGVRTVVGPVGAGFGGIQGMAFDPTVDKLFAIGNSVTDGATDPGGRGLR